jgi:hypothetical protein
MTKIKRKAIIEEDKEGKPTPGFNVFECKNTSELIIRKVKNKTSSDEIIKRLAAGEEIPGIELFTNKKGESIIRNIKKDSPKKKELL